MSPRPQEDRGGGSSLHNSATPFRAIMAQYSGAALGVLSAVLYGRKGHMWKKAYMERLH